MGRNTDITHTSTHSPGRSGRQRRRRRSRGTQILALTAFAALAASACGGQDDAATSEDTASFDAPAAEEFFESGEFEAPAETVASADGAAGDAAPSTGGFDETGVPIDFGRDLIVDAGVTMYTTNVREAVDDIVRISRSAGGAIFNVNVNIEDPRPDGSVPGAGSVEVRIEPTQLDGLISDLKGVGRISNQTQSVDDVTERLVDLEIQIGQARTSVDRMEALLAETTDFDALVAAERELVQRQTTYERLLAAQRNIDNRVALSTLTIEIGYQSPAVEAAIIDETDPGIADAFADGWTAFVGILFGLAFVLAVSAPFLVVLVVVGAIAWLVSRRLRRRAERARNRHEPLDRPLPAPVSEPAEELADANPPE